MQNHGYFTLLIYKQQIIGLYHHPFLNSDIKKNIKIDIVGHSIPTQSLAVKEEKKIIDQKAQSNQQLPTINQAAEQEIETVTIKNIQVDSFTVKLMQYCWGFSKINCLKYLLGFMTI